MRHLLLLFLTFSTTILSQTNRVYLEKQEKVNLSEQISYYEDKTNSVDFNTLITEDFQKKFIPNQLQAIHSYTPYTYWFRVDITNKNPELINWILEISYPHLDSIDFYFQKENSWHSKKFGDHLPFHSREYFSRFFVLPLHLEYEKNYSFFVKVKTETTLIVPLTLYTPKSYLETNLKLETMYAIFYGALGIMILYNAFIYLTFKSRSYLYYSINTLITLFFYIAFNGHGFQYIWPENIFWQNHAVIILTSFSWISMLAFTSRFLEFNNNYPQLRKISIFIKILFLLVLLVLFISTKVTIFLQNIIAPSSTIFILTASILCYKKGNKYAKYYIIAWITFLIGSILFICYLLNLVPRNIFTMNIIQIGTLLELILLSFALADRYQHIQSESLRIQKESLERERKINELLEEKVNLRTAELNKHLELIKSDLVVAQKIQEATLKPNTYKDNDFNIIVKYISMNEVGGDYYSIDKIAPSITRFFLADATGHGVQAALIMMAVQGIYDGIKNYNLPANEIVEIFNREFIHRYSMLNTFLTCVVVDLHTDEKKIFYCSAGHPAGLLIKKNLNVEILNNTGRLIGYNRKDYFAVKEFPFNKGDRLFIFTDGMFEQYSNSIEFGEERLHSLLIKNKNKSITYSIDTVLLELNHFLGQDEKQDDMTMIGIEYSSKYTE